MHCNVSSIAFSHSSFLGEFHALIAHPASLLYQKTSSFNLHSHVSQHCLYHLEGSNGLAKLTALLSIFNSAIQRSLSDTNGYSTNEGTSAVQGVHGNAEAFAFAANAIGFGDNNVLQHQLAGVGGTDTHLVFLFANAKARSVLRNDEGGQATDAAGFTGVSKYQENFSQATVGDEHLGAIQGIGAIFFILFCASRNATGITTSAGLGQSKGSQTAIVQNIAVHFLLFVGASQQHRYGCQAVCSQGSSNTGAALAQLFINGSNSNAVQAGAIQLFRNDNIKQAHFVGLFHQAITPMVLFVHFSSIGSNFLFNKLPHHFL